jgi:hypothetical protein
MGGKLVTWAAATTLLLAGIVEYPATFEFPLALLIVLKLLAYLVLVGELL